MKRLMLTATAVFSLMAFCSVANAGHDFNIERSLDDLGRSAFQTSQYGNQDDILLAGRCGYGRSYYRGGGGYYAPPRRSSYYHGGGGFYGGHYHYAPRRSYYRGGYPAYYGRGFGISIGF